MAKRRGKNGSRDKFPSSWALKITADGDCSQEIRRWLLLGRKAMTNIDSVLKSKGITLSTKMYIVKAMGLSSSHVWIWELYHKGRMPKNWCFQTVVLEKILESPLDSKEIKPVNSKEINPDYSLEGLMLTLNLQYFGHLMRIANSLEKTLMLGKIEGRRRKGQQRIRWLCGITDSWTWTWANSRRWWGTGKPGVLKSRESQSGTWLGDWTTTISAWILRDLPYDRQ